MRHLLMLLSLLGLIWAGCGIEAEPAPPPSVGGKSDTGWVSPSTYEIDGEMEGTVTHEATGQWADLATDQGLQEQLVEDQIKFGKVSLAEYGYHLNQLAQKITLLDVEQQGDKVTIRYSALVDMTAEHDDGDIPADVDELFEKELTFPVPVDPVGIHARAGEDCAADWDPYVLAEHKYYYYFAPDNEDCKVEMHQARLALTRVHQQIVAFPEYDQLLGQLEDGTRGFTAALMPGEAHDRIKRHLEEDLELKGADVDGESFRRYRMSGDGVAIVIDLYPSPYQIQEALGQYQLIYYHGHSNYGTQSYFTNKDAFAGGYQIFMVNACRTYSYYARQILEQKATPGDPEGWAAADVVVNVEPNWISYSAQTLKPLLQNLLDGMQAVQSGEDHRAASWHAIIGEMEGMDSIRYGVAGVSTNAWHPSTLPE